MIFGTIIFTDQNYWARAPLALPPPPPPECPPLTGQDGLDGERVAKVEGIFFVTGTKMKKMEKPQRSRSLQELELDDKIFAMVVTYLRNLNDNLTDGTNLIGR